MGVENSRSAADNLRDLMIAETLADVQNLHAEVKKLPALLEQMPGAADREIKRAADAAIASLGAQVGSIAQEIAGNAAATEKANAMSTALKWAAAGVVTSALVFGFVGFVLRDVFDSAKVNNIKQSKAELDALDKRLSQFSDAEKKDVRHFLNCEFDGYHAEQINGEKMCVTVFNDGVKEHKVGWKMP